MDTGGIIPDDKDFIPSEIFRQAKVAFEESAAIIMVVDARTEIAGPDRELARLLCEDRQATLPCRQQDGFRQADSLLGEFHAPRHEKYFPVSAEHGRGIDDLLDAVLKVIPTFKRSFQGGELMPKRKHEGRQLPPKRKSRDEIKVAIIGHPNVGKSTLLNQLTGTYRAIVSPIAGTTRDSIDEVISITDAKFASSTRRESGARARPS